MTFASHLRTSCRFARSLAPVVLSLWLAGCGSSSNPGGAGAGTAMMDGNNYRATSQMTIPTITTQAGTDLTLDWSGIKKDLLCHAATGIVSVTLAVFPNKKPADLEAELSVGVFNTAEVNKYFIIDNPTGTSTMLTSLLSGKSPVDPATDYTTSSGALYLLLFANSTTPGVGAESMVFLQPSDTSTNTTVMAPDACDQHILQFSAQLGTPLPVPNSAPYPVDWSNLTHDGFGNPIQFTSINKVEVGYYQGMQVSDLMTGFLDVELNATKLYSAAVPVAQKHIDLGSAKTKTGEAFPGFTQTDGVYAMALLCNNCSVPAPIAFTIVQAQ